MEKGNQAQLSIGEKAMSSVKIMIQYSVQKGRSWIVCLSKLFTLFHFLFTLSVLVQPSKNK